MANEEPEIVMYDAPIGYDKQALQHFRRSNYLENIKGHYADGPVSANILRNSVAVPRNFDSNIDRFKIPLKGGHYAQPVNLEGLAFKTNNFHKPHIPMKEDIPMGRPLF